MHKGWYTAQNQYIFPAAPRLSTSCEVGHQGVHLDTPVGNGVWDIVSHSQPLQSDHLRIDLDIKQSGNMAGRRNHPGVQGPARNLVAALL